jgi:transcription antitermination factor NusG
MASQAQRAGTLTDLFVRQMVQAAALEHPYFAIRTMPRSEHMVRDGFWSFGQEALLLRFFPSYVFARFHPGQRLRVAMLRGVHSIVGCAGRPTPVDSQELDALLRIEEARLTVHKAPYPGSGKRVRVNSGVLEGVRGYLIEEDFLIGGEASKTDGPLPNLVVSLSVLQRSVAVRVDRKSLVPERSLSKSLFRKSHPGIEE